MTQEMTTSEQESSEEVSAGFNRERLSEEVARIKNRAATLQEEARSLNRQADHLTARARSLTEQAVRLSLRANWPHVSPLQAEANRQAAAKKEAAEQVVHRLFRDVLAGVTDGKLQLCWTAADLPPTLELPCDPILLTATDGLRELRRLARQESLGLGLAEDRWNDLVTAVQEAGMNAVVHAGGGTGRISTNGENTVQVRVEDGGSGIEVERLPRALLEKGYSTAGTFGHGMKMMVQAADRIWLWTGPSGTTVVLEQDRITPKPAWL